MFRHFNVLLSGDTTKKRKRGRPTKSEMLARQQAEREETIERKAAKLKAAEPQQAEEDEDDVVDAGAIDDPEGEKERDQTPKISLSELCPSFTRLPRSSVPSPRWQRLQPGGCRLWWKAAPGSEEVHASY